MASALDIIKRARRLLNALGVGETLDSELANDGLEALNAMLESWSIDGLMTYALAIKTLTLTTAQTYTVGAGGAFNITRPDRIESAFVSIGGSDYPLEIIDNDQWNNIANKSASSTIPAYLKYDAFTPLGLISLFPKPINGTLTINAYESLQRFETLTEVLALPSGYERALAPNLAMEIAPETGKPVTQDLARIARDSKAAIMRINAKAPILKLDGARTGSWRDGLNG